MPQSQSHWGYDLLTVLVVVAIGAFVFWALPVQAETTASVVDALRCTAASSPCARS